LRRELGKSRGPVALGNEIGRARVIFTYAEKRSLIPRKPAYGDAFQKPSRRMLRVEKAKRGKKDFDASEVRQLVAKAKGQLKAMVLLGINAALGQSDVSSLPLSALDLDGGRLIYPRGKTGIDRRCPLWAETIAALREVLKSRTVPKDKDDAELVFITEHGNRW